MPSGSRTGFVHDRPSSGDVSIMPHHLAGLGPTMMANAHKMDDERENSTLNERG